MCATARWRIARPAAVSSLADRGRVSRNAARPSVDSPSQDPKCMRSSAKIRTKQNWPPHRRRALRAIDSSVGCTADGDAEITLRISLVAACCPWLSASAASRRAFLVLSSWRDCRRASTCAIRCASVLKRPLLSHAPGEARHQLYRLCLLGRDRQPGDSGIGPRSVPLADPPDRPNQRHLVAELVGDGGDGLVFALGQEQLLDLLRGVAEAAAEHHLLVKVLVAMAHAADVEGNARLHARERAAHIVGDGDLGARLDLEAREALAAAGAPESLLEPGPQHRHQAGHEAEG